VAEVRKYSVSVLWCLQTRQLYRIDTCHTLRDTIKGAVSRIHWRFVYVECVCGLFIDPVICSDSVASSFGVTGGGGG